MLFPNFIYEGDSGLLLKQLKCDSIDIIITSPPYKYEDGFSCNLIREVFSECYRILKPKHLLFVNFGHLADDKGRPFRVAQLIENIGFNWAETFVWIKNHYKPIQGKKRVNNLTEFIFMFYKGEMPDLNRLAIGIPYKDKSNAKRFNQGKDLKCAGNVWHIPYETITRSDQKLHYDRFPLGLPTNCIKLSGLKSGICLDPFAGSATTCLAAKNLGLDYIGIDKNPDCVKVARERLK